MTDAPIPAAPAAPPTPSVIAEVDAVEAKAEADLAAATPWFEKHAAVIGASIAGLIAVVFIAVLVLSNVH